MKKLYLLTLLTALSLIANAQAPNWQWAQSAGGISYDYGSGICTDASGNVLVTCSFQSDSITFGSTTLTQTGVSDILVVK